MESDSFFFPFHSTCLLHSDFTFRWLTHQLAMALLVVWTQCIQYREPWLGARGSI